MTRHNVVKFIYDYCKENNLQVSTDARNVFANTHSIYLLTLQDPKNKQFSICDDALYKLIGVKRFRMFGMIKVRYLAD